MIIWIWNHNHNILYQLDKKMQTLPAILWSTVQCMTEWADTQLSRPVSRALLVCFGAFWKQPKKRRPMPAGAAASGRTAHNTQPRSLIFCSNHTELMEGFMLLAHFEPNKPLPPPSPLPSSLPLILDFLLTPLKNSTCLLTLIFRAEIFFVFYKQCCILCSGTVNL